jgi:galactokinase
MPRLQWGDDRHVKVWARVPGRVNLIGDHTDYTGGLVLPMAIDRWTYLEATLGGDRVRVESEEMDGVVDLALPSARSDHLGNPAEMPRWGRYVAAAMSELDLKIGLTGQIRSEIPVGAGLSSSAALGVALVLAMTPMETPIIPVEIAQLVQRIEHRATGVPTGIMDQLCIVSARIGHATLIDCAHHAVTHIPVSDQVQVQVVFVADRTLDGSAYTDRVHECAAVEALIGPLYEAEMSDLNAVTDEKLRRRASHVVTENLRVRSFAAALKAGDHQSAGQLMKQSHSSLATDYEVSTPRMDEAVSEICALPGVWGARMTGGGFGGCVVALTRPEAMIPGAWKAVPVGAAQRGLK